MMRARILEWSGPNRFEPAAFKILLDSFAEQSAALARSGRLALSNLRRFTLLSERNKMVAVAHELPASGYAIEVDGFMKIRFATSDGARAGAVELKKRFPLLCIRVYDAEAKVREEIQLPQV
jgi:hypothetical protein